MNYDIELNANDSSVLETQYAFTQGDYGQIQFSIRVKADGSYVTNAQRAYIVFTLPNGYVVTGADMSKNVATYIYPFQGSELQVAGTILADVKLVYTNGQISSNKFSFICRYDPLHDKSFNAGPYISQLQQIVDDGQAKINYLQSLIDILQTDVGGTPVMRSDLHNTRDAVASGLKAIDANMAQNILLRSDVTNQVENDPNKIAGAASLHSTRADLQGQITTLNSDLTVTNGKVTSVENSLKTTSVYYDASKVYSATISWFFNRPVFFSADSWDSDYKNSCPILNQQWIVEYLPFEMSEVSDGEVVRAYQRWHAIENKEIYERWANNGVWSAFVKK